MRGLGWGALLYDAALLLPSDLTVSDNLSVYAGSGRGGPLVLVVRLCGEGRSTGAHGLEGGWRGGNCMFWHQGGGGGGLTPNGVCGEGGGAY